MEPDKTPIVHGEDGTGKPRGGAFIFFDWRRGEMTDRVTLGPPGGGASRGLRAVERIAGHRFGLFWENGSVSAVMVVFAPRFDEAGRRRIAGVTDNSVLEETVERSLNGALLWDEVKDQPGHSALGLSGGQMQRLCIARAIAVNPEIILMGEPASALDPIATGRNEDLIDELKQDYTVVIVTHNMHQAARISEFTAFLYFGELIEFSKSDILFNHPHEQQTQDYITGRSG